MSSVMRLATRRKMSGGVSSVAQRGQRVVHERVGDEVDHRRVRGVISRGARLAAGANRLQSGPCDRPRWPPPCSPRWRSRPAGAQTPRAVSLVVTGGTVVTMDAARRVIAGGAVAIDGARIVAVGTGGRDRRRLSRPEHDRRDRPGGAARADQHPYPRADGALPRPGRRPGADGLAAAVHLPGRGQDGVAGVRPHRHAAGRRSR